MGQTRDWNDCREGAVASSPISSQQKLERRRTFERGATNTGVGGGESVGQRRDWNDCREGDVAISPTSSQQRLEGRRTFGGMKPVGELVLSQ